MLASKTSEVAFRLWLEYYYLTELYDAKLGGTRRLEDGYTQVLPKFHKASHNYAAIVRIAMNNIREKKGVADWEWERAKYEIQNYRFGVVKRLYHDYDGEFLLSSSKK